MIAGMPMRMRSDYAKKANAKWEIARRFTQTEMMLKATDANIFVKRKRIRIVATE